MCPPLPSSAGRWMVGPLDWEGSEKSGEDGTDLSLSHRRVRGTPRNGYVLDTMAGADLLGCGYIPHSGIIRQNAQEAIRGSLCGATCQSTGSP